MVEKPPSIAQTWPVTRAACGDSSQAIRSASSRLADAGQRILACRRFAASCAADDAGRGRRIHDAGRDGIDADAGGRIGGRGARTSPSSPALAAATASWLGVPMRAAADDTSTAAPPQRASRRARQRRPGCGRR